MWIIQIILWVIFGVWVEHDGIDILIVCSWSFHVFVRQSCDREIQIFEAMGINFEGNGSSHGRRVFFLKKSAPEAWDSPLHHTYDWMDFFWKNQPRKDFKVFIRSLGLKNLEYKVVTKWMHFTDKWHWWNNGQFTYTAWYRSRQYVQLYVLHITMQIACTSILWH